MKDNTIEDMSARLHRSAQAIGERRERVAPESITRVKIGGAAEITGVPVGTLRFWRATNQGPRSYVIGRRLWYEVADLDVWLDEQRARSVRGGLS